jgi:LytS/YehU family sensor histidine kinase
LIPVVIVVGTLAGAVIAAITTALVTPFFWDGIVSRQLAQDPQFDATLYFARLIVGGALQNQLFVSAWAFIYISVTGSRRIKETEVINLRLSNSLREAQLSSLSNQLNPHFLFNALNNIRFMIHENARQADAMMVALSEILRYSLASSEHEKVSLRQELAVIEQYIAIVKIQMEQRLQLKMDIDPALLPAMLPPMVLQMLVENAIKHGLDQLPQGGTLHIDASADGGQLVLRVVNDVPSNAAAPQASMGIGLKNIQQRLGLLYGDKAGLRIAHGRGQFTANLHFPLEPAQ